MPDYQIILTRPDETFVSTQVSAAPSVWDEFLAIQLRLIVGTRICLC
jgi:hypothetical protein